MLSIFCIYAVQNGILLESWWVTAAFDDAKRKAETLKEIYPTARILLREWSQQMVFPVFHGANGQSVECRGGTPLSYNGVA